MNTTTNTRGVEIPGLIEMSDLLRKRGVETRSYRDHEIAEAAFRAALEAALSAPEPAAQGEAAAGGPSTEAAEAMGAKGGPAAEAERLAFEAWMKGHCWALGATWRDGAYRSDAEQGGKLCPHAMQTRGLWAAWRDRAALAAPPAQPAERVPVSIEAAIAHIQKKADDYAEENCDVEWDTGATVYHYGQAGEDYHHVLLELVDELTQLAATPAPSEGGKGVDRG